MKETISIKTINPNDEKVLAIIEELSENLYLRFGSDGKNSFTDWENDNSKFVFVTAQIDNDIVGCGAIRPINDTTGEVKRMYSKFPGKKTGQTILAFLENKAIALGYTNLVLETRVKNESAVQFYQKQGYKIIPNYGKYTDRPEAICLGKSLN
ncbi:ribosomal protein S18 acetylase RimI-like enzyme [Flavobacterium araucananum]|uniref:GNAT family N-acetyltransferase n=1 Tax=Flavobacterium araucananum TaxID=946678 RepID=A0A227PG58_9FLAO|nr:GNAT family N-acetyltransferase [Flavobacterium araucananum]OXG08869.1 GNAT family N-acetyltransferase [Flavobacterium araucananum]PWJ97631.1 ribosomal protein S18 acetylase RimI-like enzyme [Flavobacterium araucananum]